jgi:branched-chain amino acid transport system substrate-binding protein
VGLCRLAGARPGDRREQEPHNDDTLAAYMHQATFQTVVGEIKFGPLGEWTQERTLAAQFQNIKGNGIDDFRDTKTEVIVYPPQFKSGEVIYPYEKAIGK